MSETPPAQLPDPLLRVDPTKMHPSRRYNYWLGGKDHFAADRKSGDRIAQVFPTIRLAARENRRFLNRAVSLLAKREGLRQFLDLGTGFPVAPCVHDLAQRFAPDARVVYLDHDPMVVAHLRARLVSTPPGAIAYVRGDLRAPDELLAHPELRGTLDFTQPIGLLLAAVLHFLDDSDRPYELVERLVRALPPGSFLVLSHATFDPPFPASIATRLTALTTPSSGHGVFRARSHAELARFLTGLQVIPPGLVPLVNWYPEIPPHPRVPASQTGMYAAVARIP